MDSTRTPSWTLATMMLAIACGPGADGTGSTGSTGTDDGDPTTATLTATTSATSPTTTATSMTDPTGDPTSATETGTCPVGSALCPCTNGGSCDPGLVCVDGTCVADDCSIGALDCPCTGGGVCDPGLVCEDGICGDDGDTSPTTDATTDATTDDTGTETGEPIDLDDWAKRRPILIDNPNDVALDDHQVMIDLDWDDDMEPDLADLRFTDATGTDLLPHWIEDYVAPVSLRAWVRVPHVDAMDVGTIYVWYGNAAASDSGDPEATFNFWEDFDGNALDEDVWTATDEVTVQNGYLSMTGGSVYSNEPLATQPGYVVEARMRWPSMNEVNVAMSGLSIGETQGDVGVGARQAIFGNASVLYGFANEDGATIWGSDPFDNVALPGAAFGYFGIGHGDGMVRLSVLHIHSPSFFQEFDGLFAGDYYFGFGDMSGSVAAGINGWDLDVDHVFVRRFHNEILEAFAGGEEDV